RCQCLWARPFPRHTLLRTVDPPARSRPRTQSLPRRTKSRRQTQTEGIVGCPIDFVPAHNECKRKPAHLQRDERELRKTLKWAFRPDGSHAKRIAILRKLQFISSANSQFAPNLSWDANLSLTCTTHIFFRSCVLQGSVSQERP